MFGKGGDALTARAEKLARNSLTTGSFELDERGNNFKKGKHSKNPGAIFQDGAVKGLLRAPDLIHCVEHLRVSECLRGSSGSSNKGTTIR